MSELQSELQPEEQDVPRRSASDRLVESLLVALVVVVCGVVGVPKVVESIRTGDLELATVFYPVLLVAFGVLAWTRRTDA